MKLLVPIAWKQDWQSSKRLRSPATRMTRVPSWACVFDPWICASRYLGYMPGIPKYRVSGIPRYRPSGIRYIYRVSHDTGHPETWPSSRLILKFERKKVWDFVKGLGLREATFEKKRIKYEFL